MTLTARWVPDAVEDMQGGYDWYEERQPGLGRAFAIEVFNARDKAVRFPLAHRRYEHATLPEVPEVRRVTLERFTEYGMVFTVIGDTFWILAVAHAKRRPGYWASRIKEVPADRLTAGPSCTRE